MSVFTPSLSAVDPLPGEVESIPRFCIIFFCERYNTQTYFFCNFLAYYSCFSTKVYFFIFFKVLFLEFWLIFMSIYHFFFATRIHKFFIKRFLRFLFIIYPDPYKMKWSRNAANILYNILYLNYCRLWLWYDSDDE